jgi:hypothetical protein
MSLCCVLLLRRARTGSTAYSTDHLLAQLLTPVLSLPLTSCSTARSPAHLLARLLLPGRSLLCHPARPSLSPVRSLRDATTHVSVTFPLPLRAHPCALTSWLCLQRLLPPYFPTSAPPPARLALRLTVSRSGSNPTVIAPRTPANGFSFELQPNGYVRTPAYLDLCPYAVTGGSTSPRPCPTDPVLAPLLHRHARHPAL